MMVILFNYINIIINYIYFIIDKIIKKYTKKQVSFKDSVNIKLIPNNEDKKQVSFKDTVKIKLIPNNEDKKQVSFKDSVNIKLIPNNENENKLLHVRQYMRIYDIEITESIYDYDLIVYFKSDKIV